jgi:hypothetical protein
LLDFLNIELYLRFPQSKGRPVIFHKDIQTVEV